MKSKAFIIIFTLFTSLCRTQSLDRSAVSTFGLSYAGSNFQADCTTGEVISYTGETNESFLTQGFHQPYAIVAICQTPYEETIDASACTSYELNGESYSISGSYTQMLIAADGCDSIIYLNLQLNTLSNEVTTDENALIATQDDATYKWTLCGEQTVLSTTQTFTPTQSGDYQVTITQENCEVISECVSMVVGVEEVQSTIELSVFPNPTRDNLQLEVKGSSERFGLTIYDAMGNLVMTESISSSKTKLSVGHLANGTYVVVLRSNFLVYTKTFVKS
jgi:Secretion system C-terminal sorting domain